MNNATPIHNNLPDERKAITHKFSIAQHIGYLTVDLYEDDTPGAIYITMSKEGSTISGLLDAFASSISISLQYGIPLKVLAKKFCHTKFDPYGYTNNKNIPLAKSIIDYVFKWLGQKFLNEEDLKEIGITINQIPAHTHI